MRESMNSFTKLFFISIPLFITASCSTTQQAYLNNIDIYFDSKVDVTQTIEDVKQSSVDLIYVKNGERPRATMALAFLENGQFKWISRDKVLLITENGRLAKTIGLDNDLNYISNLPKDPLKKPMRIKSNTHWNRVIDTDNGDYGANLSSTMDIIPNEQLLVLGTSFTTDKYSESVVYKSKLYGEQEWTNTFWFHIESGQLLKSIQKTSAQSDALELTYLTRASRLLGE